MNPIDKLKNEAEPVQLYSQQKREDYLDLFISISQEVKDGLILKGNILLNELLPESARGTNDLDFDVVNADLLRTVVNPKLIQLGEGLINMGLASKYRLAELTDRTSGGIKVYDSNGEVVYEVDVGLNKLSGMLGKSTYKINGVGVLASSVEKIVADKCLSTLHRVRFRRTKDFYDLFILYNSELEVNYSEVLELMINEVGMDEVDIRLSSHPFSDSILLQLEHAWLKFKLQRFDGKSVIKPTFKEVLVVAKSIYNSLTFERNKLNGI